MIFGISQPNFLSPEPSMSKMTCIGCRERGYKIINCGKVGDLIRDGLLARDNIVRLTYRNEARIQRFTKETIIQAYKRS